MVHMYLIFLVVMLIGSAIGWFIQGETIDAVLPKMFLGYLCVAILTIFVFNGPGWGGGFDLLGVLIIGVIFLIALPFPGMIVGCYLRILKNQKRSETNILTKAFLLIGGAPAVFLLFW